jgi:hypothetical protein
VMKYLKWSLQQIVWIAQQIQAEIMPLSSLFSAGIGKLYNPQRFFFSTISASTHFVVHGCQIKPSGNGLEHINPHIKITHQNNIILLIIHVILAITRIKTIRISRSLSIM